MLEKTIVIADEQPLCREGLVALLGRTWPELATVQTNRFAGVISALSSHASVAMAIVDLALPDLNDIAGLRQLRRHYPDVRIAVTASSLGRDTVVDCLRAGVHGCIAKSHPAGEIVEALDAIGSGRIYVPAIDCSDDEEPERSPESPRLLSERQREVLKVLASGKSNKEIARELGIAEGTVKVHVNAAFRTLGVHNRVGAVAAFKTFEASEPSLPGLLHPYRRLSDQQAPSPHET